MTVLAMLVAVLDCIPAAQLRAVGIVVRCGMTRVNVDRRVLGIVSAALAAQYAFDALHRSALLGAPSS